MVTKENLNAANAMIETIQLNGKQYATVNSRMSAFRAICPRGRIETEIIAITPEVVTMKATIYDEDGTILASGHANEEKASSFVNKTSYVENCETSAVGRAFAMLGIGIDESMASAEELANALKNQEAKKDETPIAEYIETINKLMERKGVTREEIEKRYGAIDEMNAATFAKVIKALEKSSDKE